MVGTNEVPPNFNLDFDEDLLFELAVLLLALEAVSETLPLLLLLLFGLLLLLGLRLLLKLLLPLLN